MIDVRLASKNNEHKESNKSQLDSSKSQSCIPTSEHAVLTYKIDDEWKTSNTKKHGRSHTPRTNEMIYSGPRQISNLLESRNLNSSSMRSQNLEREGINDELQQAMPKDDKGYDSSSVGDNKDKSVTASTTSVDDHHKREFTAKDFREFRKGKESTR